MYVEIADRCDVGRDPRLAHRDPSPALLLALALLEHDQELAEIEPRSRASGVSTGGSHVPPEERAPVVEGIPAATIARLADLAGVDAATLGDAIQAAADRIEQPPAYVLQEWIVGLHNEGRDLGQALREVVSASG
jgi:hypothetical protein